MPRLEQICLPSNAKFYKLKSNQNALTKVIIKELLEKSLDLKCSNYHINQTRKEQPKVRNQSYILTAKAFKIKKKVSFYNLPNGENFFDEVHGYVLIFEIQNYVIVFRKAFPSFEKILLKYTNLVSYRDMLKVMDKHAELKSISLRNMTVNKQSILGKSYNSMGDLKGQLSPMTSGKAIPSSLKFTKDNMTKSITSSSGRISSINSFGGTSYLAEWVIDQVSLFEKKEPSTFFTTFAIPIPLHEVLQDKKPIALMIEVNELMSLLEENELEILVRLKNRSYTLRGDRKKLLFLALEKAYTIENIQYDTTKFTGNGDICSGNNNLIKGKLKIREKKVSFNLKYLKYFSIYKRTGNNEDSLEKLQAYIIKKKLYTMAFNDFRYMYYKDQCFREDTTASGVDKIIELFIQIKLFEDVTSEKGECSSTDTMFPEYSMFKEIEEIHKHDEFIWCNDFGDEWADHITFSKRKITFIHSKNGAVGLGASKLHEVVGQGIKNLGNMSMTSDMFDKKAKKLERYYKSDGVETKIPMIRKGGILQKEKYRLPKDAKQKIKDIINDVETQRICILSCSFLSLADIKREFKKLKTNKQNYGYIHQMFWILSSFENSCREAGVIPKIYCRP